MQNLNPAYVQIGRQEAATILGISSRELDRLRTTDPQCPVGFNKPTLTFLLLNCGYCVVNADELGQ
jgi:hypothetical protein